ncbi:MAG TPA: peptidylprolyl isomerase [Geobacteraceae bacterium]|nr:peptidylprolyl isomerase [Geobacteraceae bacterium]
MFRRSLTALTILLTLSLFALPAGAVSKNPTVLMETSLGNVTIELFQKDAPISVKNFLSYVKDGFYNGTVFHRVIPGFMVQGGGFTSGMKEKTTKAPIRNEAANGLKNDRGTLAMARTANPDSASAQFFINVVDNQGLNRPLPDGHGYAVFGKVVKGMDVVDKIAAVKTGTKGPFQDVPLKPVVIKSVKVVK